MLNKQIAILILLFSLIKPSFDLKAMPKSDIFHTTSMQQTSDSKDHLETSFWQRHKKKILISACLITIAGIVILLKIKPSATTSNPQQQPATLSNNQQPSATTSNKRPTSHDQRI